MSADSAVASNDALAYLNIDIENNPGWVAGLKGGYQWKLFRKAGVRFGGTVGGTDFVHNVSRNITKSGAAGTVTLGYNFGNRIPLTIGVAFGQGPAGKLRTHSAFTAGGTRYRTETYQRVNIYTFDFSADYDFRNCSRWIPFIGLTGGLGFVSQHGNGHIIDAAGTEYGSGYEKRKRVNFIVGARAGTKWKLNDCVTFSLYGSYSYLGKVKSKSYDFAGPGGALISARTNKITAHQLDVKFGVKISF